MEIQPRLTILEQFHKTKTDMNELSNLLFWGNSSVDYFEYSDEQIEEANKHIIDEIIKGLQKLLNHPHAFILNLKDSLLLLIDSFNNVKIDYNAILLLESREEEQQDLAGTVDTIYDKLDTLQRDNKDNLEIQEEYNTSSEEELQQALRRGRGGSRKRKTKSRRKTKRRTKTKSRRKTKRRRKSIKRKSKRRRK